MSANEQRRTTHRRKSAPFHRSAGTVSSATSRTISVPCSWRLVEKPERHRSTFSLVRASPCWDRFEMNAPSGSRFNPNHVRDRLLLSISDILLYGTKVFGNYSTVLCSGCKARKGSGVVRSGSMMDLAACTAYISPTILLELQFWDDATNTIEIRIMFYFNLCRSMRHDDRHSVNFPSANPTLAHLCLGLLTL